MESYSLLDVVETKEKRMRGVVDYIATKNITFYDLSRESSPQITALVVAWRCFFPELRFAVFVSLYCPNIEVPRPILVSKKSIVHTNKPLITDKPKRKKIKKGATSPNNSIVVLS